jgi:5-methylcytosine-specific restriction endonuclease McrA
MTPTSDHDSTGPGCCELCLRQVAELTFHHLIPRSRHGNKRNRQEFSREEVKERLAKLCRPCHANVHDQIDNKELERSFNTLQLLAYHPAVERFSQWIGKRPDGISLPFAGKKRRH